MSEPETTVLPLPRRADATARAWLLAGSPQGSPPRQAATVCLLRDGDAGTVEVLWITRGRQLAVAPGLLAFPGGAVDDVDRLRRSDDPGYPDRFTVLARAAARELAEETGHAVAPQLLRPLVRWVTPEHEPRRYDSTFLVGVLSGSGGDGARAPGRMPPDHEVHEHGWAGPAELLAALGDGTRAALPPTRAVLGRLQAAADGVGAATAVARLVAGAVLVPVVPRAVWREGPEVGERGVDLLLPRHAGDVP
ncbi:NUDIX domain-containing protein [Aquipuribacter sp. MA13-6]|uniref:NUDIX domain-containing protein n=1 Tax=unclassified Aquipuribacter TaxID=2635084 RepID=UPI003EE826D7